MFYIQICVIQYRSNPEPLWLCKIFSLFKVHLGELLRSGEVHQFT